ncbi:hypothetical protein Syun_011463 [Stephania yunnanensis]|uniref:GATA transcription factor n=1 Tax=Stephania yunnanensis TaxID=152371 RepID=A0AAP0JXK8_9MAGN
MEAPEFYHGGYYRAGGTAQFQPENNLHSDEHFAIDDLLDFTNEDAVVGDGGAFDNFAVNSADSSALPGAVDSCNSSFSGSDYSHFPGDAACRGLLDGELCVPYDELAQLEWLSTFTEESFSSEDQQRLQLISGMKARSSSEKQQQQQQQQQQLVQSDASIIDNNNNNNNNPIFSGDVTVPGKARSKRSRAAPGVWSSRLLTISPTSSTTSSESDNAVAPTHNSTGYKGGKGTSSKKKEHQLRVEGLVSGSGGGGGMASNADGRKCLHCATDKTPQWRTGPMGPKTLCNACGVRYKSGRLVPEYRPAASPTFVLTQHSNSHRKVMELRRQKEVQRAHHNHHNHHHHYNMHDETSNNGMLYNNMCGNNNADQDTYLIHHHGGHDYRQLI